MKTHLLVVAIAVGGDVGTFVTGAAVVVGVLLPSSKGHKTASKYSIEIENCKEDFSAFNINDM